VSRQTATVLFTDLVGSTELRGRLGEEAADELRRRHDHLLGLAVEANNGRVVKGLGDGIMATFTGASSDATTAAWRSLWGGPYSVFGLTGAHDERQSAQVGSGSVRQCLALAEEDCAGRLTHFLDDVAGFLDLVDQWGTFGAR
jgi:hypothetical protein